MSNLNISIYLKNTYKRHRGLAGLARNNSAGVREFHRHTNSPRNSVHYFWGCVYDGGGGGHDTQVVLGFIFS